MTMGELHNRAARSWAHTETAPLVGSELESVINPIEPKLTATQPTAPRTETIVRNLRYPQQASLEPKFEVLS